MFTVGLGAMFQAGAARLRSTPTPLNLSLAPQEKAHPSSGLLLTPLLFSPPGPHGWVFSFVSIFPLAFYPRGPPQGLAHSRCSANMWQMKGCRRKKRHCHCCLSHGSNGSTVHWDKMLFSTFVLFLPYSLPLPYDSWCPHPGPPPGVSKREQVMPSSQTSQTMAAHTKRLHGCAPGGSSGGRARGG